MHFLHLWMHSWNPVSRLKYGKPVIAFAGAAARDAGACNEQGIDAFFPILREAVSLEAAMKRENAEANMEAAVEQAYRLWRL